jgi:hypothetical protein
MGLTLYDGKPLVYSTPAETESLMIDKVVKLTVTNCNNVKIDVTYNKELNSTASCFGGT